MYVVVVVVLLSTDWMLPMLRGSTVRPEGTAPRLLRQGQSGESSRGTNLSLPAAFTHLGG